MTQRRPLPPALVGRPFAVRDARAAGVPNRRLDAKDLDAPVRGARVPAGGSTLHALNAVLGTGQAFTGPTAAKVWGMPLPRRWEDDPRFWVSSLSRDYPMRRPGVVGSRRSRGSPTLVGGISVLSPALVWCSLAQMLELHDLIAVTDRIVTASPRDPALGSAEQLEGAAAAWRRGVRNLQAALSESRVGSWSRPESLLRIALLRAGIPEPRLNEEVAVGRGRFAAPDLAWLEFKVAVEYDGHWHNSAVRRAADLERHELLVDAGWLVTHIRARDLFPEPLVAVARVLRRLTSRGYHHPRAIERSIAPSWAP